jgi:ribosome assembly protein 1
VSGRALDGEPRSALRAVMRAWLPLSEAVLGMAVQHLPDPKQAAPERLPRLLALGALDGATADSRGLPPKTQQACVRVILSMSLSNNFAIYAI